MDSGKVLYYLDMWRAAHLKSNQSHRKLGYPSKASGFMSGGISSFDDMYDELDTNVVPVIDTAVNSLPILQQDALHIIFLGKKRNMTDMQLELNYDLALENLQVKLTEKNLY
jgi:hypothetical protein